MLASGLVSSLFVFAFMLGAKISAAAILHKAIFLEKGLDVGIIVIPDG
jgi:hypothetical protein